MTLYLGPRSVFLRSQGEIQRAPNAGLFPDDGIDVIIPPHRKNDLIVIQVINTWLTGSNIDIAIMELAEEPAGYEMIPNFIRTQRRGYRLYWKIAESASEARPRISRAFLEAADVTANTLAVRVAVFGGLDGVDGGISSSAAVEYDNTDPANGPAPALSVVKQYSTLAAFYFANPTNASNEAADATSVVGYAPPASPPFGRNPQTLPPRHVTAGKVSLGVFLAGAMGDVGTSASDHPVIPGTSLASYAFISISIAPVEPFPRRDPPKSIQRLGCASNYEVLITREVADGGDPDILESVRFSSLSWSRVLDDISEASVTLPDAYGGARCCAHLGGLRPWEYGLIIERDAQPVWRGPVTKVSRPVRDGQALPYLVVSAKDSLARLRKRFGSLDTVDYVDTDAGEVLRDIINVRARRTAATDRFHFLAPRAGVGSGLTRTVLAREFDYAWDLVKELGDDAVDFTMIDGQMYVWEPGVGWLTNDGVDDRKVFDGPYHPFSGELTYGVFTEESWAAAPGWDLDGEMQATFVANAASDSGEDGFRRAWFADNSVASERYGRLEYVEVDQLYRSQPEDEEAIVSESAFEQRAQSILALRSEAPAMIEGGHLAGRAPVAVPQLFPGAIWRLDVYDSCFGQLLQRTRLKRVEVEVDVSRDGMTERVSPVLHPVGYEELA